jgi:nitrogen regulatory protein PII
MPKQAIKLVIITERLLFDHIVRIIEAKGGTGYTVTAADGKGQRTTRPSRHPSVSDALVKMKLEMITTDQSVAQAIADEVANKYFDNFSGIIYFDQVEVLYAHSL